MPTTDFNFESVLTYNGSTFGDMTLEAQKPGGTAFGAFVETDHLLYLGHSSRFDMAVFSLETLGSLGTLKYEYYNGSAWTETSDMNTARKDGMAAKKGTTSAGLGFGGNDGTTV